VCADEKNPLYLASNFSETDEKVFLGIMLQQYHHQQQQQQP
jgi:hypothetical protein